MENIQLTIALVVLDVLFIIFIRVLMRIERWTQDNGIDLGNLKMMITGRLDESKRRDYNARKRDEKVLRRIGKQAGYLFETQALVLANDRKIEGVSKQVRGIDCIVGKSKNDCMSLVADSAKMRKELDKAVKIMKLFEAMTEKAKRGTK